MSTFSRYTCTECGGQKLLRQHFVIFPLPQTLHKGGSLINDLLKLVEQVCKDVPSFKSLEKLMVLI